MEPSAAAPASSPYDHFTTQYALLVLLGWLALGLAFHLIANVLLPRSSFPGNTVAVRYRLACLATSASVSIYIVIWGVIAINNLGDNFLYSTYMPLVVDGARVGFTYFVFDIASMYLCHAAQEDICHLPFIARVKSYLRQKTLLIVHHAAIAFVALPFGVIFLYDKGHIVMAAFALQEASTPFLSIHQALKLLDKTHTKLYVVNGILFITTFFVFRLCMFPYLYWRYHCWAGTGFSFVDTMLSLPWHCHAGAVVISSIQYYWFLNIMRMIHRHTNSRMQLKDKDS